MHPRMKTRLTYLHEIWGFHGGGGGGGDDVLKCRSSTSVHGVTTQKNIIKITYKPL
jgi:hypothetical protein